MNVGMDLKKGRRGEGERWEKRKIGKMRGGVEE
jgi:hypothetical protein